MSETSDAIHRANRAEQRWADEVTRANALAARVQQLEQLLRSMWVYGPLSSDKWEDEWRELVKAALAPTQRDTP